MRLISPALFVMLSLFVLLPNIAKAADEKKSEPVIVTNPKTSPVPVTVINPLAFLGMKSFDTKTTDVCVGPTLPLSSVSPPTDGTTYLAAAPQRMSPSAIPDGYVVTGVIPYTIFFGYQGPAPGNGAGLAKSCAGATLIMQKLSQ